MANYETLKAAIQQAIKQNGNNEITGALLQSSLLSMINSLGAGYQFAGIATTTTNPGTPDQNVFYLAFDAGTYTNFNSTEIVAGQIGVFAYNGTWTYSVKSVFSLVNDLTTGGANKSLSAQMGVELFQKIKDVYSALTLNRFDKNNVTIGYVQYNTGIIVPNENYRTSDYIPVVPGVGYRIRNNDNQQIAIYDKDLNYVSGYANSNTFNITDSATQIPATGAYLRFCMGVNSVDNVGFYSADEFRSLNPWYSNWTEYKSGIIADKVKGQVTELSYTVSTMAALLERLSYIVDTVNYHYTIYLTEGTYVLTAAQIDAIETTQYGRIGILLPDNVDLVGLGSGAIITCDLTGQESGYQQYISPINIKWNNRLKNLKVVANNCRYAVHCDNSNAVPNIRWEIEDCEFTHYGNSDGAWSYNYAWGEGGCSGHKAYFRNCIFRGPAAGFYVHNNTNFDEPMYHEFVGCKFISSVGARAFAAESLGSGTKDVLNFIGCSFDGLFDSRVGSAGVGVTACDWVVIGNGNSPVCENWYYTDGIPYHSIFGDEVIAFQNRTENALTAGAFMKYDSDKLVPMEDGDDGKLFVGFLLDNVAAGGVGYVKIHGTYRITSPSGVVWSPLGTRVKVENYNTLGVADSIYNIGKMYYRNTTYTRYYILMD